MTVQELINELNKIEDKKAIVKVWGRGVAIHVNEDNEEWEDGEGNECIYKQIVISD